MGIFRDEHGAYSKEMVDGDLRWYAKVLRILVFVEVVMSIGVFVLYLRHPTGDAGTIIAAWSVLRYFYVASLFIFISGMVFRGWGPHVKGKFFEWLFIPIAAFAALNEMGEIIMDPIAAPVGFSMWRAVATTILLFMGISSVIGGINGRGANCSLGVWPTNDEAGYINAHIFKVALRYVFVYGVILFVFRLIHVFV
ncbi:MAG: hypothetical protein PHY34_05105 [Patescibacteria group bacterium]|nr:hypothetical protein [Patescibacteria group bacterium]MDD5715770.1 hypothetical protein [Patescibacteria group bacterium]